MKLIQISKKMWINPNQIVAVRNQTEDCCEIDFVSKDVLRLDFGTNVTNNHRDKTFLPENIGELLDLIVDEI